MRQLVFLNDADDDLIDILDAISRRGGGTTVAEVFVQRLRARCRDLADLPGILGQSRNGLRPGLRSTPHGNYIIFFRYIDDRLEIVDILHSGRDLEAMFEVASE